MPTKVSTGSLTIVDVNDGLSANLTNNAVILPADVSGIVSSYAGAETNFVIYEAGVDTSSLWGFYVSAIGSGITYRDINDTANRSDIGPANGVLDTNFVKITSLTQASSWIDITATKAGMQNLVRRFSVARANTGATGTRGTMTVSRAISGSSWSSTEAASAISGAGGGSPLRGDTVTLYRNSPAYSETRVFDGTNWITQAAYIAGSQVIDGSLNGGKITAGTIVSDRIAANTIQTSRLAISDFENYAVNGELTAGNVAWGGLVVTNETPVSAGGNAIQGTNVIVLPAAVPPASAQRWTANDNRFSVKPGDQFWLEWAGKATSDFEGSFSVSLRVNRPDGTQISTYGAGSLNNTATDYTVKAGNITIPADGYIAYLQISYANTVGSAYIGYVRLRKRNEGALIVDGAITTNHVATNSITANKMLIGDTTNYVENANFQAGNVGWQPDSGGSIVEDATNAYNGGTWVGRFAPTALRAFRNNAIMTVAPGDELYAYATVKTSSQTGGSAYLRIAFIDAANGAVSFPQSPVIINQADYGKMEVTATVPANAVGARLEVVANYGSSGKVLYIGAAGLMRRATGALIVDGAIQAKHVQANTMTAREIAIGDFQNLAINGDFSYGGSSWDGGAGIDFRENAAIGYNGSAFFQNRMPQTFAWYSLNQNRIPVTAGDEFYFEWVGRQSGTYTGSHYGVVVWYDTAGNSISEQAPGAAITSADAGWKVRANKMVAPTNAAFARVGTLFNNTAGNAMVAFVGFRRRATGNLIVDGTIEGIKIKGETISGDKLIAGTVNASRINITDMANLVPDSSIVDPNGWVAGTGSPAFTYVAGNAGYAGNYISIPTKTAEQQVYSLPFPVEPSKPYYASGLISTANTGVSGRVHVTFYTDLAGSAGAYISDEIIGSGSGPYSFATPTLNRVSKKFIVPANAKSARFIVTRLNGGTGAADFAEPIVKRATSGELIVDGTITGAHIKGETITGDHLEAGTIKAAQIGAGEIVASKIAIGNTDNIVPDGDMQDLAWWMGNATNVEIGAQNGNWSFRNRLVLRAGYNQERATPMFPVEPGATYKISVGMYTSPDFAGFFNPTIHVPGVLYYSLKSGTSTGYPNSTIGAAGFNAPGFSSQYSFTYTNPTGVANNANKQWQFMLFGNITAGYAEFMVKIVRVSDATLISDGAILTKHITVNTLNGDRILADSIDADKIKANSILAGTITVSGAGSLSSAFTSSTWAGTTGRPTNLAGINSTEGSKLSGIASNATVGATVGTNLKDSTGANLVDADVKNNQATFQPVRVYTFDGNTLEGCVLNGANATFAGGILTMTATSADPFIRTGTLGIAGARIPIVRVRARPLVASASWEGACYYTTSGHGENGSYYKRLATPSLVQNQWQIFEWDMSSLTAGGTDYINNTITSVRVDLANSQQNWEIDWVAFGNLMPAGTYVGDMLATDVVAGLFNLTSDDVLSKAEKSSLTQWKDELNNDYDAAHAASMSFNSYYNADLTYNERLNAGNKLTDLNNYLNGLSPAWTNTAVDTAINGATLRTKWDAAYTAIAALQKANMAVFSTRAQWGSVGARPANLANLTGTESIKNTDQLWSDIAGSGKPETYTVSARGNLSTNLPANYTHGMRDSSGAVLSDTYNTAGLRSDRYARSYTVMWKYVNQPWAVRHFDIYGNGQIAYPDTGSYPSTVAGMAQLLLDIAVGTPVIIYTSDEPANNRLTGGLPGAIYRCGGSKSIFASPNFTNHSSYVLIGQAGVGEGNGVELFSAGGVNSFVRGSFSIVNGVVTVGGQNIKDARDIVFDDGRGLNDLRGVAAGATVGATWGTNVASIPTPLSQVGNSDTVKNNAITINGNGQITGIGTGTNTAVANTAVTINAQGQLVGIGTTGKTVDNANQLWGDVSGVGRPADYATAVGAADDLNANSNFSLPARADGSVIGWAEDGYAGGQNLSMQVFSAGKQMMLRESFVGGVGQADAREYIHSDMFKVLGNETIYVRLHFGVNAGNGGTQNASDTLQTLAFIRWFDVGLNYLGDTEVAPGVLRAPGQNYAFAAKTTAPPSAWWACLYFGQAIDQAAPRKGSTWFYTYGASRTDYGATVGAPAGTYVGSYLAQTVADRSNDPAARVNEVATAINPGKILIQGAATLDSWRDATEIRGGAIKANTIGAEKLTINNRGMNFINTAFYVSADKRFLYWTAGHANFIDDNGTVVTPYIGAGGCDALSSPASIYYYIYWIKGQGLMSVSYDDPGAAMGGDRILVCTWTRGTHNFNANFGGTIIHGDRITTGTIDANRIRAGTVISNLVQVENTAGMGNIGDAIVRANDPAARINAVGTTISGGKITTNSIEADRLSVSSLSAISANIGSLVSYNGAGGRVERDGNGARLYDNNGTLRMRWGFW